MEAVSAQDLHREFVILHKKKTALQNELRVVNVNYKTCRTSMIDSLSRSGNTAISDTNILTLRDTNPTNAALTILMIKQAYMDHHQCENDTDACAFIDVLKVVRKNHKKKTTHYVDVSECGLLSANTS
jgi:hypothetical protein